MSSSIFFRTNCCARFALILAFLGLQGCFNFHEKVAESGWQEVGQNASATPRAEGKFILTTLRPGRGNVVRAGDLVYIRLRQSAPAPLSPIIEPRVYSAWLWTGHSSADDSDIDVQTWGSLGSASLRNALVGKAVGERLDLQLQDSEDGSVAIPLYGVTPGQFSPQHNELEYLFPAIELRKFGDPDSRRPVQVEILQTCRGHYYRRSASLEQWGYPLNAFDSYYPVERQGQLAWSALQGDCPEPRGKVRFELGPLFYKQHQLLDWDVSYRRAHRSSFGLHISPYISLLMVGFGFWIARRW